MADDWKNKAEKVEGLTRAIEESLRPSSNSSNTLVDLVVDEASKTAAYIVDVHYYQIGIGMFAQVYGYANGRQRTIGQGCYRDHEDPRRDNYRVQWTKINELSVKDDLVEVKVSSPGGSRDSYKFYIRGEQK